jgi:hypothetical protein
MRGVVLQGLFGGLGPADAVPITGLLRAGQGRHLPHALMWAFFAIKSRDIDELGHSVSFDTKEVKLRVTLGFKEGFVPARNDPLSVLLI